MDEITLRENNAGWERLKLYYRVLAGVGERDMTTTVLGQPISMPIVVAPTAFHKLACEAGEIATARAAKAARTLFILSSLSNTAMEPVFAQAHALNHSATSRRTESRCDRLHEVGHGR